MWSNIILERRMFLLECFWMRLTFISVHFEWSKLPSMTGWASSNQLKVLLEQKIDLPQAGRNSAGWLPSHWKLQYWHSLCLQSARSTYSGVDSFHAFSITWAKSLKQSLSPHTHTQTSRHTQRKEKPMRVYNKLLLPSLFPSFFLSSLPSIFPEFIQGKDR